MAVQRAGLRAAFKSPAERVGIPGDFSVPAVRVVEITEGIYNLAPKILSMRGLQSLKPPNPPKGRPSKHRNPGLIEMQELDAQG